MKLGTRNTKHFLGDYVRRAWSVVLADSVCKELNWFGKKDKRFNGGNGKRGIHNCFITKAIRSTFIIHV